MKLKPPIDWKRTTLTRWFVASTFISICFMPFAFYGGMLSAFYSIEMALISKFSKRGLFPNAQHQTDDDRIEQSDYCRA